MTKAHTNGTQLKACHRFVLVDERRLDVRRYEVTSGRVHADNDVPDDKALNERRCNDPKQEQEQHDERVRRTGATYVA
jgi:hypothetical protein